jgi:hypothetical protein
VPREWLRIDEGGYLSLLPEHDSDEACGIVDEWMQTACPHRDMRLASEFIANWPAYRVIQQALDHAGWDNFPTLHAELPHANGGLMSSEAAALALKELAYFHSLNEIGRDTFLVETATGEVLDWHVAAYDGVPLHGGTVTLRAGIGPFDFFVNDPTTGADLFRSVRFRQTKLEGGHFNEIVELEDLDGSGTCRGPIAIRLIHWPDDHKQPNYTLPTELHVESRVVTPGEFEHILGPLERLFQASIETGHPVRWE